MKTLRRFFPRNTRNKAAPPNDTVWIMAQSQAAPVYLAPILNAMTQWDSPPALAITASAGTYDAIAKLAAQAPDMAAQIKIDHPKAGPDTCGPAALGLWCDPAPVRALSTTSYPLIWIGANQSGQMKPMPWWRQIGPAKPNFARQMRLIQPINQNACDAFMASGIHSDTLLPAGDIRLCFTTPQIDTNLRSALKLHIGPRPIVFTQNPMAQEIDMIVMAFAACLRTTHRALLVMRCADETSQTALIDACAKYGLHRAMDKAGLTAEHQVYGADQNDDINWPMIANATILGGSYLETPDRCAEPWAALSAGSILIHGTQLGRYKPAIAQLARAGGTRRALTAAQISAAIHDSFTPDIAAKIAAIAWDAIGAGSYAANRVMHAMTELLDQRHTP